MPKQQIGNVNFNYKLIGDNDKSTIVFISGYTCDINLWRPIAETLKEEHQILMFDNQGIGATTDDQQPLNIATMADTIKQLLDQLEIDKPVLVGYAMGSNIAMQIALNHPDYASKLILLSPTLKWSEQAKQHIYKLITLREQNKLPEYFTYLYEQAFGTRFKQEVSLNELTQTATPGLKQQSIVDQKRQAEALMQFDLSKQAQQIKTPTIILAPKEDNFASPRDAATVANTIPNAKLIELNCGHAAIAELENTVAEIIQEHCCHSNGHTTSIHCQS